MAQEIRLSGKLVQREYGEDSDVLFIEGREYPLSRELEDITKKKVTCRYWITDQQTTRDDAQERFLRTLMGEADVQYEPRYSEITGYLWTDEDLNIGGHDLLAELCSSVGKWLILEIDVHNIGAVS